jgi:FKBP-type peptidyl-prolyl cis-trans isomerase SlyD
MQIQDNRVVNLAYTLKDNNNEIIDESNDGSFCYLHGASNIITGLENSLTGKRAGDVLCVTVAPEHGYGVRDDERIQEVPREMFPDDADIEAGMQFHAEGPDGQNIVVMITRVNDATVTVDGNHPLAGVQLNFDVKVLSVREATAEELEHGHVHGPHGHHHHD